MDLLCWRVKNNLCKFQYHSYDNQLFSVPSRDSLNNCCCCLACKHLSNRLQCRKTHQTSRDHHGRAMSSLGSGRWHQSKSFTFRCSIRWNSPFPCVASLFGHKFPSSYWPACSHECSKPQKVHSVLNHYNVVDSFSKLR